MSGGQVVGGGDPVAAVIANSTFNLGMCKNQNHPLEHDYDQSAKVSLPTQEEQDIAPTNSQSGEPAARRRYLVGIGASAGGLEALSALISALPIKLGLCYVVVQHLSTTYRSMLVQLLSRDTAMAVKEIEDGCSPEPDTIFITPAAVRTMRAGFPSGQPRARWSKPSVNVFLPRSPTILRICDRRHPFRHGARSQGIRQIKASVAYFAQEPLLPIQRMPQSPSPRLCRRTCRLTNRHKIPP